LRQPANKKKVDKIKELFFFETILSLYSYGVMDNYGSDYFMQKDIILVTINYRVGSIGFLSLEDPELNIPGNAGLKDQVLR
jgi:Carboxylesterase family